MLRSDGSLTDLPLGSDSLQQFTAKRGEQGDICEVRIETTDMPTDLVLVDTPGVNDINQTRSEIVYQLIPEADALLFVMDVQQPLKRSEVDFLRKRILTTSMVKTIFVLNHVDRVANVAEIGAATDYVRKNLATIYKDVADSVTHDGCVQLGEELRRYANNIPIFTISAKKMMASANSGQDNLEGDSGGLRRETFDLAAPGAKNQTVVSAGIGQTAALLARLRREINERLVLQGVEHERVLATVQQDSEVLRKTVATCKDALKTVETRRGE